VNKKLKILTTRHDVLSCGNRALPHFFIIALAVLAFFPAPSRAQAALLLEEPYGFFGALSPTGHNAIFFARICAASQSNCAAVRRAKWGAVIARRQGISGIDWIAIPLVPYLYSVETPRCSGAC